LPCPGVWESLRRRRPLDLVKLAALSHNVLHGLEHPLQKDEEARILAFAYHPISGFDTDIGGFLREPLALCFIQAVEHRYLRQLCPSDHVVVCPALLIRVAPSQELRT
jgi:hypothetical protein